MGKQDKIFCSPYLVPLLQHGFSQLKKDLTLADPVPDFN